MILRKQCHYRRSHIGRERKKTSPQIQIQNRMTSTEAGEWKEGGRTFPALFAPYGIFTPAHSPDYPSVLTADTDLHTPERHRRELCVKEFSRELCVCRGR